MLSFTRRNGAKVVAATLALVGTSSANAFSFDVGDTKASVYGFLKLNAIYDVNEQIPAPVGANAAVALDGENRPEGVFQMNARSSRVGFRTSTPTEAGTLTTAIEYDFVDSDGGGLRLRHAYGEWNGILVGQTWTNFGRPIGMVRFIDDMPPPGVIPTRQAQVRYTIGRLAVALEEPSKLGGKVATIENSKNKPKDGLPDFTLSYVGKLAGFNYAFGGLVRQLSVDDGAGNDDSTIGWGMNLHLQRAITSGITLRAAATYGDGIGSYVNFSPVAPAYADPTTGEVKTIKAYGGAIGLQIAAGPGTINISHGIATGDLDDAVASGAVKPEANETYTSTHLNYIISPVKNVEYGIEVARHTREVYSGADGDAIRIQAMAMYHF